MRLMRPCVLLSLPGLLLLSITPAAAQAPAQSSGSMSSMDSPMMRMMNQMHPQTFIDEIQHHASSGTSAEPNSTPAPMLMTMKGAWMLMFHANIFIDDFQQSGPRGHDKLFSTNWMMPMAERRLGSGQLTLRTMLSLEPATVTG